MPSPLPIVLVFEEESIREECLLYSIERARRMGCRLYVLHLLEQPPAPGGEMEDRVAQAIARTALKEVQIQSEVRYGDKISQMLKFLATIPEPGTVVWGSDESVLVSSREKSSKHWLAKIREELPCPIITSRARGA